MALATALTTHDAVGDVVGAVGVCDCLGGGNVVFDGDGDPELVGDLGLAGAAVCWNAVNAASS